MKLKVERHSIKIIPESETDEAYLEEVLGLHSPHDSKVTARRVNAIRLSCWAYLELRREDGK